MLRGNAPTSREDHMSSHNQYSLGLDKTPANYVALTPLSFTPSMPSCE